MRRLLVIVTSVWWCAWAPSHAKYRHVREDCLRGAAVCAGRRSARRPPPPPPHPLPLAHPSPSTHTAHQPAAARARRRGRPLRTAAGYEYMVTTSLFFWPMMSMHSGRSTIRVSTCGGGKRCTRERRPATRPGTLVATPGNPPADRGKPPGAWEGGGRFVQESWGVLRRTPCEGWTRMAKAGGEGQGQARARGDGAGASAG